MDCGYDEIISENIFYTTLLRDYHDLFMKGVTEGCILCVPRMGSISRYSLSLEVFCAHILVPSEELPESHFLNISGEEVRICNRVVTVDHEIGHQSRVHILFEETFYCKDGLKYKILCIEKPIGGKKDLSVSVRDVISLSTLRECVDFLWIESGSPEITEKINHLTGKFLQSNRNIDECSIETVVDRVRELYVQCVRAALRCPRIRERVMESDGNFVTNINIAVETCMLQGMYTKIMKIISTHVAQEDANLNKILRNLSDVKIQDFDIRPEQYDSVLNARLELSKIDGYSTVLGKSRCLKKMFLAISECATNIDDNVVIGADDVLQILIFLIIKINLPNWNAQLKYLKLFRFSAVPNVQDEVCFLITSLEAAIQHIQSGMVVDYATSVDADGVTGVKSALPKGGRYRIYDESSSLHKFYKAISLGDLEEVKRIAKGEESSKGDVSPVLCHPLCSCSNCKSLTYVRDGVSVNSHDTQGLTPLHIASMYSKSEIVEFLLSNGADANKSDVSGLTPIHYASLEGNQNGLLLLAYAGAEVNAVDHSSNTPLHFSSNNGHESCVKALIYFCETSGLKLNVNARNSNGDTPLHNASRWGYLGIVEILLESGADPTVRNNRKMSSIDVAHNSKILELLTRPCTETRDYVRIIPFKPMFDHAEEESPAAATTATTKKQRIKGVLPSCKESLRKVERVLKAIADGDRNLACFYLGLDASEDTVSSDVEGGKAPRERCHPLCRCSKCEMSTSDENQEDAEGASNRRDSRRDVLNVNSCNTDGYTALHVAAIHGRTELCRLLVKNGALLDAQTRLELHTPLMLACRHEQVEVVQVLLKVGCRVDMQDGDGNTALHHACFTRNNKIVESLLMYDPDLGLRNNRNRTPLQEARENLSIGMMKALRGRDVDLTAVLLDDSTDNKLLF